MKHLLPLAAACAHGAALAQRVQSAVHPQGAAAADIARIWWAMLAGGVLIFAGVLALVLYAMLSKRPRAARHPRLFIVGGGVVFPAVVLGALLVYTVLVGNRIAAAPPAGSLRIEVTGHMWWWDVRYAGAGGETLATANELRIPVGRSIDVQVRSADVIHSFWVPSLAGKIDMIPGRTNRITLRADAPGTWRGQCAEYCGLQHTWMALHVVALPVEEWEAWFAARRLPPPAPATQVALRGRALFAEAGCVACHAVRGLSDPPRGLGPDLTHVGSRPSLAAGLLPNNRGTLAAWIASPQALKPGSRMPAFQHLDADAIGALAAYLSELR